VKTAIYVEDGVIQVVLTPETDFEKDSLHIFGNKPLKVEMFEGSFYDCRGGWVRQNQYFRTQYNWDNNNRDNSLILKVSDEPEIKES